VRKQFRLSPLKLDRLIDDTTIQRSTGIASLLNSEYDSRQLEQSRKATTLTNQQLYSVVSPNSTVTPQKPNSKGTLHRDYLEKSPISSPMASLLHEDHSLTIEPVKNRRAQLVKPCLLDDLLLIKVQDSSSPFANHLPGRHLDSKKNHFANRVKKQIPCLADNSVYQEQMPLPKTAELKLKEGIFAVGTFNGTFVLSDASKSKRQTTRHVDQSSEQRMTLQ
jgi:hypothetical protein